MVTLRQMMDLYPGAGEFSLVDKDNLDSDIVTVRLTAEERGALIAFLKALTDDRVRFEKAPFDHPKSLAPNGHPGNETPVINDGTGKAQDCLLRVLA